MTEKVKNNSGYSNLGSGLTNLSNNGYGYGNGYGYDNDNGFMGIDIFKDTDFLNLKEMDASVADSYNKWMESRTLPNEGSGLNMDNVAKGIGALSSAAQSLLGFQQIGQGKKQLAFEMNAWQKQFDIKKGEYDRRVRERNERVAANRASSQRARSLGA